ncbi:MAG: LamG domain-containing protein [Candidatus Micrarchaeaceae archaeon]
MQGIKLEGVCNNESPQYVAGFNALAKSHISTPYMTVNMPAITVGAWFYLPNINYEDNPRFVANGHTDVGGDHRGVQLSVAMGGHIGHFDVGNGVSKGSAFWWVNISSNKWYYYAGTYNSTTGVIHAYINGRLAGTGSFNGLIWSNLPISLGYNPAYNGDFVNGLIANVQIYNTSLSAGEIETLYLEGIGGVPIDLQNLAAWWPLNGNANDYSGNGYNGVPYNVTFLSNWNQSEHI